MRALLLLALVAAAVPARAQGACDNGSASVDLNANNVVARLYNTGGLFWRGGGPEYEVPVGTGLHAIYAASLWVGGVVGPGPGSLRFAGSTYGPYEYYPGPLLGDGTTTAARCAAFDRFWKVTRQDLRNYDATGGPFVNPSLVSWPIAQGAPFYVDANRNALRDADEPRLELAFGDPGYSTELGQGRTLDLAAGERPDIVGDQGVWWIMNDAGGTHGWGNTPPLRVEVRVLAYAFGEANPALWQSTFYSYTITNRSAEPIRDVRAGFWADMDLGDYRDDYIASDAARGMLVGYNGREVDDPAQGGYGASPPALGIDILTGAVGTYVPGFVPPFGGVRTSDGGVTPPVTSEDRAATSWAQLQSVHSDGTLLTRGGNGYNPRQTEDVTTWHFDGDPLAHGFWTEERELPQGGPRPPGDRRAVISAGPETLAPGASRRLDLAILFERSPVPDASRSRLQSVAWLRGLSDAVQAAYDAGGPAAIREATVTYTTPPPPPGAATLLAPATDVDFNATRPDSVTFSWTPVPGATRYRIDLSASPDFDSTTVTRYLSEPRATLRTAVLPSHDGEWTYWRVTPLSWGGVAPPGEVRRFAYSVLAPHFTRFEVVANGGGALNPPELAAAGFAGFPVFGTGTQPTSNQQTNRTRWLVHTGGDVSTFEGFVRQTTRDGANWPRIAPAAYEIRFTGTSRGKVTGFLGQTGPDMTVPFEVWNVGDGTPGDPSDDVRLVPVVFDADGDGTFSLSTRDSPVSPLGNDPYTDALYVHEPVDRSPGQAGYLAFAAAGDAVQIGAEVLANVVFVGLNLGTAPPYRAPTAGGGGIVTGPEPGTVFRISTDDRGGLVGGEAAPEAGASLSVSVQPNPVRGQAAVPFTLAAAADVRLVLVDVLGREVAVLAEGPHAAGSHRAALGASRLAAGVYVLVLEAGGERATRRLTVAR